MKKTIGIIPFRFVLYIYYHKKWKKATGKVTNLFPAILTRITKIPARCNRCQLHRTGTNPSKILFFRRFRLFLRRGGLVFFFVVQHTVAVALEVRVSDLLAELLAHTARVFADFPQIAAGVAG